MRCFGDRRPCKGPQEVQKVLMTDIIAKFVRMSWNLMAFLHQIYSGESLRPANFCTSLVKSQTGCWSANVLGLRER